LQLIGGQALWAQVAHGNDLLTQRVALRGNRSSGVHPRKRHARGHRTGSAWTPQFAACLLPVGAIPRHGVLWMGRIRGMPLAVGGEFAASNSPIGSDAAGVTGGVGSHKPLGLRDQGQRCMPFHLRKPRFWGQYMPLNCRFSAGSVSKSPGTAPKLPVPAPMKEGRLSYQSRHDCISIILS